MYEQAIMRDIEYILQKIANNCLKKHHSKAVNEIINSANLNDLRERLCKFSSEHMDFSRKVN